MVHVQTAPRAERRRARHRTSGWALLSPWSGGAGRAGPGIDGSPLAGATRRPRHVSVLVALTGRWVADDAVLQTEAGSG
ncbi:hypothetical protein Ae168Ps1_6181c [Pseudonocardia sp. Ae168_Ps1]|nr:hypothetical protein Ae168Ps1_6181c [Pseudonocardia sp. Ae168_Ps1]OLL71553.1 hypothetical protein Ae263Ps1_6041c [Pseudonocardia sp. Ae263_Ps1]